MNRSFTCYAFCCFGVLFLSFLTSEAKFPSAITKCHMKDEKCMTQQADIFVQTYKDGIPELGVQPLEPFKLADVTVLGNKQSAASIDLYLSNIELHNITTSKARTLRGFTRDTSKPMKLLVTAYTDQITLKAKYKVKGNVLILPIVGEGDMVMVLTGIDARTKVILKPVERDGKTYFMVDDFQTQNKMKNVKTDMTNLFNGDKALSENMLKVINDNWQLLNEDISPKIDAAIAQVEKDILSKIIEDVPFDEYFLPDN